MVEMSPGLLAGALPVGGPGEAAGGQTGWGGDREMFGPGVGVHDPDLAAEPFRAGAEVGDVGAGRGGVEFVPLEGVVPDAGSVQLDATDAVVAAEADQLMAVASPIGVDDLPGRVAAGLIQHVGAGPVGSDDGGDVVAFWLDVDHG